MECDYGVVFGSEQCEECPLFSHCKEYDDFSQQEDYYRDLYHERNED